MKYSCSQAKAWLGRRVINYKKNQYVKFNLTSRLYNLNGSSYDISLRRKRMKMENKIVNKKRKSNIKAMRLVVLNDNQNLYLNLSICKRANINIWAGSIMANASRRRREHRSSILRQSNATI